VRIATWNVNSLRVRLTQVLEWLEQQRPDVLALQEIKLSDDQFPVAAFAAAGYHAVFAGQKTYNGVALVSREPAHDVRRDVPGLEDPQRRFIAATCRGVRVVNLYVVNGQAVDSDKYLYKLDWLRHVTAHLATELATLPRLVVVGDFNIAPTDRDVHAPEEWRDRILCSGPERAALERLLDLGLVDSYREFDSAPGGFTWWDYRAAGFRRDRGLRIDLVLASAALMRGCTGVHVDRAPRGLERPSDHAPVVADFDLDAIAERPS